jgi:MFS family permease
MQPEVPLTQRALKSGAWVTLYSTLVLLCTGHPGWAWGFLIGALLSLFSLFSLIVVVPKLFRLDSPRRVQRLLSIVLVLKLPLYAAFLYLAVSVRGVSLAGVGVGVVLVPMIITLKTIGGLLRPPASQPTSSTLKSRTHSPQPAQALRPRPAEPTRERG